MEDSQSSGDEGNMLESFVMNSNILKKGGGPAPVQKRILPQNSQGLGMAPFNKSKQGSIHNRLAGGKQLKSLNLSKRGLDSKKKVIKKKKKKDKLRRTIAFTSLKRRILIKK